MIAQPYALPLHHIQVRASLSLAASAPETCSAFRRSWPAICAGCAASSTHNAVLRCSSTGSDAVSPPVLCVPAVDGVRSGGRKRRSVEPRSRSTSSAAAATEASTSSVLRSPDVTYDDCARRWTVGRSGFGGTLGDGHGKVGRKGPRREDSGLQERPTRSHTRLACPAGRGCLRGNSRAFKGRLAPRFPAIVGRASITIAPSPI